jgi:hypothetical protein
VSFPEIDVVYRWVNPSLFQPEHSGVPNRFRDRGELLLSMQSVLRFAPWVRRIWVIHKGPVPRWRESMDELAGAGRIEWQPEGELLARRSPPGVDWTAVDNSETVKLAIPYLDGLAPYFLLVDDDQFLGADVFPGQFVREGKPMLPLPWASHCPIPLGRDALRDVLDRAGGHLLDYWRQGQRRADPYEPAVWNLVTQGRALPLGVHLVTNSRQAHFRNYVHRHPSEPHRVVYMLTHWTLAEGELDWWINEVLAVRPPLFCVNDNFPAEEDALYRRQTETIAAFWISYFRPRLRP